MGKTCRYHREHGNLQFRPDGLVDADDLDRGRRLGEVDRVDFHQVLLLDLARPAAARRPHGPHRVREPAGHLGAADEELLLAFALQGAGVEHRLREHLDVLFPGS